MSEEEKKIIDRINRSYDDNTQYVEASAKDWNYIVHSIRKLHEEIEEKSTIIMAGAEKVKQLEKEIEELKTNLEKSEVSFALSVKDRDSKAETLKNSISKDKIKELLERNYQLQKDLDYERSKNEIACRNIDELNDIIDKYKKIIDKFTIKF